MEDEAAKEETQQDDKLKNLMLNENIKKAIEEANKFRKLEAAKKLVQDAQVCTMFHVLCNSMFYTSPCSMQFHVLFKSMFYATPCYLSNSTC